MEKHIIPSPDKLHEWWGAVDWHPTMQDNPLRQDVPIYQDKTVPLLLHGDGVPITRIAKGWCKQATVFSWASMLTGATTKRSQMYIWGAFDKLVERWGRRWYMEAVLQHLEVVTPFTCATQKVDINLDL